ncbi:MAG: MipA/OmpV family protein [Acidobacteriota bacterium]
MSPRLSPSLLFIAVLIHPALPSLGDAAPAPRVDPLPAEIASTTGPPQRSTEAGDGDLGSQRSGFLVAGAALLPEFEGADDLRVGPLIVAQLSSRKATLEIEGLSARADVWRDPRWRAGPALSLRLPRDDTFADDPVIQRLGDIELALELGFFVGHQFPLGDSPEDRFRIDVSLVQDTLDAHGGRVATLEVDYFWKVSRRLRMGVAAHAAWADDDYHRTYFSVSRSQAQDAGLPEFSAGAGLKDVGLEAYSILAFSESWGVFGRVAVQRLLNDAAKSPVVDLGSRDQPFVGLGWFYRWQ